MAPRRLAARGPGAAGRPGRARRGARAGSPLAQEEAALCQGAQPGLRSRATRGPREGEAAGSQAPRLLAARKAAKSTCQGMAAIGSLSLLATNALPFDR